MKTLKNLWKYISNFWSNLFWHIKKPKLDVEFRLCDYKHKDETISEFLLKISKRLMEHFTYTHDGVEQLGDTTPPPPYAYYQFTLGDLADDCDGYHSALYHIAHMNNIECRLYTIISYSNSYGHCVLAFKEDNIWKILDYRTIYTIFLANPHYAELTDNHYIQYARVYNYETNKFEITKEKLLYEN